MSLKHSDFSQGKVNSFEITTFSPLPFYIPLLLIYRKFRVLFSKHVLRAYIDQMASLF